MKTEITVNCGINNPALPTVAQKIYDMTNGCEFWGNEDKLLVKGNISFDVILKLTGVLADFGFNATIKRRV